MYDRTGYTKVHSSVRVHGRCVLELQLYLHYLCYIGAITRSAAALNFIMFRGVHLWVIGRVRRARRAGWRRMHTSVRNS